MNKLQRTLISLGVILVVFLAFFRLLILLLMQATPELGVEGGLFQPCPENLACVSSQIDPANEEHAVEKIPSAMSIYAAQGTMKVIMKTFTGANLVEESEQYLHYEINVLPWGFVDDVEFYFPCDRCYVEVRSSARIQFPDANRNHKRVEMIMERFTNY